LGFEIEELIAKIGNGQLGWHVINNTQFTMLRQGFSHPEGALKAGELLGKFKKFIYLPGILVLHCARHKSEPPNKESSRTCPGPRGFWEQGLGLAGDSGAYFERRGGGREILPAGLRNRSGKERL
jgi:hypothetical protein